MVQREVCRPLQEGCEVEQTLLFTPELWGSSPVKYRNDSWFMMDDHGNTMEDLVAPITTVSQRLALKNELGNVADDAKRPAPLAGGCRIEGFVRVKMTRSVAHFFDASKMNMSHIISNLSFGKRISPEVMSGLKRVVPYLGGSHDKIEHYLQVVKTQLITRRSNREQKSVEEYESTAHSSLILITEDSKSFSHFITSVCAIIGGVFT
ncbi:unnamed protein product [Camellia sinensis]